MCGRYASSRRPEDLVEEFEVADVRLAQPLEADYNVAPTKEVYAVVERPPSRESGEPAQRQLRVLTWGLVPSWAKDPSIGNRMIYARMETVADKPAFRGAFEDNDPRGRLLMIINYNTDVSQFWEWSGRGLRPFEDTNEAYKLGVNYVIYGLTH